MLKNIIFIILAIFFADNLHGQNLKRDYLNYLDALNNARYNEAMTYLPEKVFEIAPKDDIIKQFEFLKREYGKLYTDSFKITEIKPSIEYKDSLYSKVFYTADVVLILKDEKLNKVESLRKSFEQKYPKDKIKFTKDKSEFRIKNTNSFYAISVDEGKNWKFLENIHENTYSKFIPPKVLIELNKSCQ
nr:hypothetical protein [uncultured Draconibacterium sp.]